MSEREERLLKAMIRMVLQHCDMWPDGTIDSSGTRAHVKAILCLGEYGLMEVEERAPVHLLGKWTDAAKPYLFPSSGSSISD